MEPQEQPDYNKGYFVMPRELRAACAQVHKNTSQLVEFIAEQTFGWHARWVYLTYDEIRNGRKKVNGERMGPGSFLTQDKTVRRAIIDALAEACPLIEVRYFAWGTAYAIHKRFWRTSKLLPRWEFYGRTSYSPQDDPLDDEQATVKKTAQPLQEADEEGQKAKTSVKLTATDYQIDSSQQSKRQQATNRKTDEMAREPRPPQAGRVPIDTSLDTSKIETEDRYVAASPSGSPPVPVVKSKKEENAEGKDAPSQHDAPASSDSHQPTKEEVAARAAELEARERQKAEWERQRREVALRSQIQGCLITEETRIRAALKKSEPGSAEATELKRQQKNILDELDWYRSQE